MCLRWKDTLAAFAALPHVSLPPPSRVPTPILQGPALALPPSCGLPGPRGQDPSLLGEGGSISLVGRSRGRSTGWIHSLADSKIERDCGGA